jgi:hypothetical protein
MTFERWLQMWRIGVVGKGQRLGQTFCNDYMGKTYAAQIFYEEDYWEARALIEQWLIDTCHYPNMPEKIG